MGAVSDLRETSVVFAALIGRMFLNEHADGAAPHVVLRDRNGRSVHRSPKTRPKMKWSPFDSAKEVAMIEPMISVTAGIILLLCITVVIVMHHRHPHIPNPKSRWLDTHPPRDWFHQH